MKTRTRRLVIAIVIVAIAVAAGGFGLSAWRRERQRAANANVAQLLSDLVLAYEQPSDNDDQVLSFDLEAIRLSDANAYELARDVQRNWQDVYLNPGYQLHLYHGEDQATSLADAGIPNDGTHAFVILGYELKNGEMTPELEGRCEAAAAAAREFPNAMLVCSGGATGANNVARNTEAGLMRDYLSQHCGIDEARILTDERAMSTAENAQNTFEILREHDIRSITIVTSSYHQRWGQAVYNAMAARCRQERGQDVRIVGDYSFDTQPTVTAFLQDDRFAAYQIGEILGLSPEALATLPRV